MLNDYFNLNDDEETKNYYCSLSYYERVNKDIVGVLPDYLKPRDKLINKK